MSSTTEIVLIHHQVRHDLSNREFKHELEVETGHTTDLESLAFTVVKADLRKSSARVRACPFLLHPGNVRGFVFNVSDGQLREVT
jgi:carbonic anhydrase